MEPKPAHRIPIWLGAFGDRALAVTGRQADGWVPSLGYAPFAQLSGDGCCEVAGHIVEVMHDVVKHVTGRWSGP